MSVEDVSTATAQVKPSVKIKLRSNQHKLIQKTISPVLFGTYYAVVKTTIKEKPGEGFSYSPLLE